MGLGHLRAHSLLSVAPWMGRPKQLGLPSMSISLCISSVTTSGQSDLHGDSGRGVWSWLTLDPGSTLWTALSNAKVQGRRVGSLLSAMEGVYMPQKSANATHPDSSFSPLQSQLLNVVGAHRWTHGSPCMHPQRVRQRLYPLS